MADNVLCQGCGAVLQQEFPDLPGFVPRSMVHHEEAVCQRCFRIRHYSEFSRMGMAPSEYLDEVAKTAAIPADIVYVLDIFDLAGSVFHELAQLVGNHPVTVVVNKVDLLPAEVRPDAYSKWITRIIRDTGVRVAQLLFVSGQTGKGVAELIEILEDSSLSRVCVIGMANVGKSTLLNRLCKRQGAAEPFTASYVPGTTLGAVSKDVTLPSGKVVSIFDTPGVIKGNRVTDKLCADCLHQVVPKHRLRPRIYQLNASQSLFFGGLVRLDFTAGPRQSVACYFSAALAIHRSKLENAERIESEHFEDILQTPCANCRPKFSERVVYHVVSGKYLREQKNAENRLACRDDGTDISIAGLGWFSLFGADYEGDLWLPKGTLVVTRPRLVGVLNRRDYLEF